jgi:hypothetical protein
LTRELSRDHGNARVVDARRPRPEPPEWKMPGHLLGLGAALVLATD